MNAYTTFIYIYTRVYIHIYTYIHTYTNTQIYIHIQRYIQKDFVWILFGNEYKKNKKKYMNVCIDC